MKRIIGLNGFNAVGAAQTATLDIAEKYTFHTLMLSYKSSGVFANKATIENEIEEVRLKINGKVQRVFSPAELNAINAKNGLAFEDGFLKIYFAEPWRRSAMGEDTLAWGMSDVSTFQVEVDIASGVTAPALSASAVVTFDERLLGPIVKWRRFVKPVTAAGVVNETTLPKNDPYYAIHCATDQIKGVEIKTDQKTVFEASRRELHEVLKDFGFVPDAGWTHICFDHTGRVSDALQMLGVRNFQIDFDMESAATFDMLTEILGPAD